MTTLNISEQEQLVRTHFMEESGIAREARALLGKCACGEDRLQVQADWLERHTRVDALLDWYNTAVLGITYADDVA